MKYFFFCLFFLLTGSRVDATTSHNLENVRTVFPRRDCHTLVRPVISRDHISHPPYGRVIR